LQKFCTFDLYKPISTCRTPNSSPELIFLPSHQDFIVQYQFSRTCHPLNLALHTNYQLRIPLVIIFYPLPSLGHFDHIPSPVPTATAPAPGFLPRRRHPLSHVLSSADHRWQDVPSRRDWAWSTSSPQTTSLASPWWVRRWRISPVLPCSIPTGEPLPAAVRGHSGRSSGDGGDLRPSPAHGGDSPARIGRAGSREATTAVV
jgi:hypothetical protein